MRSDYKAYIKVGRINTSLAEKIGFSFRGIVYASPGVVTHIKKRHGKQFTKKVKENLISIMREIISDPSYIGLDKNRGRAGRLEIVKKFDNTILLGLEVDLEDNYIYVSTMYPINKGKISNGLYSGRFIRCTDEEI